MEARHAIGSIGELVSRATFGASENKGLSALVGHIVVQPRYQRFYVYGDGKRDAKVI